MPHCLQFSIYHRKSFDSPNSAQRAADMQTMRTFVENEDHINEQFDSMHPYEVF